MLFMHDRIRHNNIVSSITTGQKTLCGHCSICLVDDWFIIIISAVCEAFSAIHLLLLEQYHQHVYHFAPVKNIMYAD